MNIVSRFCERTPKFFRILRNLGLILAAAGGVLYTAPVEIPEYLVTLGGYLIVAGAVSSAVAQSVVVGNEK